MAIGDGDWVEGKPQWWWKYVFPSRVDFWLQALSHMGPSPDLWKQEIGTVLEGLTMLHVVTTINDAQAKERLHREAVSKIVEGANALARAKTQ